MTATNITTQELLTIDHKKLEENPDTYQQNWVSQWMAVMEACGTEDFQAIKHIQDDLQLLGQAEQTEIWQSNDHLKTPLEKMMLASEDTSEIKGLFDQLHECVERMKPPSRSFFSRFKSMFKLLFSWEKDAMALWVESYPNYRQQVDQITTQLKRHERQYGLDNIKLQAEHNAFTLQLKKFSQAHDVIEYLHQYLQSHTTSADNNQLIQSEFFPQINHRFLDIKQQLLMARQTFMTLELLIQHNDNQFKAISQVLASVNRVIEITARVALVQNKQQGLTAQHAMRDQIDVAHLKSARAVVEDTLAMVEKISDGKSFNRADTHIGKTNNSD